MVWDPESASSDAYYLQKLAEIDGANKSVAVFTHDEHDERTVFYHFTSADVFVGSRSGFSWLAGLVSLRPLVILQHGGHQKERDFCGDAKSAVCCVGTLCDSNADVIVAKAVAHFAYAEQCGVFGQADSLAPPTAWALSPSYWSATQRTARVKPKVKGRLSTEVA